MQRGNLFKYTVKMPDDADAFTQPRCGKCKSKVNSGPKCISCGTTYHVSCSKLLNRIKFISDDSIKCCSSSDSQASQISQAGDGESANGESDQYNEVKYLKTILAQKDIIIDELREKNALLKQQITLLNTVANLNSVISSFSVSHKKVSCDTAFSDAALDAAKTEQVDDPNIQKQNMVTINVHPSKDKLSYADAIKSKPDNNMKNRSDDTVQIAKPRKRNPLILGTSELSANMVVDPEMETDDFVAVKRPIRKCHIHITRVNPNTKIDKIESYIYDNFKKISSSEQPHIELTKLVTKFPTKYSSFKLSVDASLQSVLMDPSFWPSQVAVRRFFQPRNANNTDGNFRPASTSVTIT